MILWCRRLACNEENYVRRFSQAGRLRHKSGFTVW